MKNILLAGIPGNTPNYENALHRLGCSCTTSLSLQEIDKQLGDYDGLLLPGGKDIDPILFGQKNLGSREIEPALDRIQLTLLHRFVLSGKPILGICKGMQLIQVYFGGSICQHLPSAQTHEWKGADQYHASSALPNTLLSRLYSQRFNVNSAHHQGIEIPAPRLAVMQYADDQVIEGLYHKMLPIVGVQWHPERLHPDCGFLQAVDGSVLIASFLSGYAS